MEIEKTFPFNYSCATLLLIFLIFSETITAQPFYTPKKYNADSLLKILPEAQGKSRAEILMLLSGHYSLVMPDSAIYYAREAFGLSPGLKDREVEIRSIVILGLAYHHKGDFPSAVRYGLDGERLAYEINDTTLIIQAVTYIVLSYLYSGNDELAIQKALGLRHYLRNWNDPFRVFDLNIRLGWLYLMAKKYQEAIPYFRMCDSIALKSAHIPAIFANLTINHLARCYRGIALYDSALYHYHRLLGSEKTPDAPIFSYANQEAGMCHFLNGAYDSAAVYLNKSLEISKLEEDYVLSGISHLLAADLAQTQKQWIKAIGHYNEVIGAGKWVLEHRSSTSNTDPHSEEYYVPEQHVPDYIETTGLNLLMKAHYNSYLIYSKLNNPAKALYHLEQYNNFKNRQDSLEKKKDVLEIATRYETQRKEEDIIRLSREKQMADSSLTKTRNTLFVLVALMLLLVVSAILLARQYRMKNIHETSLLKQKLFRAQMNPHFIFNALSNIQGFIMEKDNIRAATYLSRFAKLVRNILEGSLEEFIPLQKEIESIEHYLQLQEIRYSGHIGYQIDISQELQVQEIMIPPMLVQPFVENAIEHGLKSKPAPGMVKVSFERKGKNLEITIIDNGIGRKQSGELKKEEKKNNTSLSTSLIVECVKTINREKGFSNQKGKINMEITDLCDEAGKACGTKVLLSIPV